MYLILTIEIRDGVVINSPFSFDENKLPEAALQSGNHLLTVDVEWKYKYVSADSFGPEEFNLDWFVSGTWLDKEKIEDLDISDKIEEYLYDNLCRERV